MAGCLGEEPHRNKTVGLGGSAVLEEFMNSRATPLVQPRFCLFFLFFGSRSFAQDSFLMRLKGKVKVGSGNPQGREGDPKPYRFIGFGDIHGPKPYRFIGFGEPLE